MATGDALLLAGGGGGRGQLLRVFVENVGQDALHCRSAIDLGQHEEVGAHGGEGAPAPVP